MATYLVMLSPHERRGRRFVKLAAPTLLAWFQQAWKQVASGGDWETDLRGDVYGLGPVFDQAAGGAAPPRSDDDLVEWLQAHLYYERDLEAEAHFVHVETDDDEVAIEYFFFDDVFLQTKGALDRLPAANRRAEAEAEEDEDDEDADDDEDDEDDDADDEDADEDDDDANDQPDDGYAALIARLRR